MPTYPGLWTWRKRFRWFGHRPGTKRRLLSKCHLEPMTRFAKMRFWRKLAVPLEFRGLALMDPRQTMVRFAGYPASKRNNEIVICQISAKTLRDLAGVPLTSEEEFLSTFEKYKEPIFSAASAQFDEGVHRPTVEIDDL